MVTSSEICAEIVKWDDGASICIAVAEQDGGAVHRVALDQKPDPPAHEMEHIWRFSLSLSLPSAILRTTLTGSTMRDLGYSASASIE